MIGCCFLAAVAGATLTAAVLPVQAPAVGTLASVTGDATFIGPTYPVTEPDLLKVIEQAVAKLEGSGEAGRIMIRAQERALKRMRSPAPVQGLAKASRDGTVMFDPSVALAEDIVAADGSVLFRRGMRVNPLDHVRMPRALLLFDGSDPEQVGLAEILTTRHAGGIMPVLVGGSWLDLTRDWKRKVYYDQGGALVRRLGIREIPALVEQSGRFLRISVFGPLEPDER